VSAPERREPQSEAARDSRPPRCVSPPSTLVPHPIVRSPPRVIPDFSNPSTQHHQRPARPTMRRAIALSFSPRLCLPHPRRGPTIRPQPRSLSPSSLSARISTLTPRLPPFFLHLLPPSPTPSRSTLVATSWSRTYVHLLLLRLAVCVHHRANFYTKLPIVLFVTYLSGRLAG